MQAATMGMSDSGHVEHVNMPIKCAGKYRKKDAKAREKCTPPLSKIDDADGCWTTYQFTIPGLL